MSITYLAQTSGATVLQLTIAGVVASVVSLMAAYLLSRWWERKRISGARSEADRILSDAQAEAEVVLKRAEVEAKAEHLKAQEKLRAEANEMRGELKEAEKRLAKREDNLEAKLDTLVTKERNLEQTLKKTAAREESVAAMEEEAKELLVQRREQLLQISGMSADEAKRQVLADLQHELEQESAEMIEKATTAAREEAVERSRQIVLTAIQRYAGEHTAESTVSAIDIPSDEMKGRVIGREGRNIRAFEKATGVDVIVDDTPGVVVVSAFDPVRREVARRSLARLIPDGPIHPGRIEELVAPAQKDATEAIGDAAKKAAVESNIG
ncbi:MAG: Rnase Y domain-containing protein, partial [Kiloniellales bacterium]|nr:Rnase Y domain-containing protein [Kiloniellales bacterium]